MIEAALVLPPTKVGIIEASIIRRLPTRSRLSTGHLVLAHIAGAGRVVDGVGASAQQLEQLLVAVKVFAVDVLEARHGGWAAIS
ncbi:hypothetical protein D9M69_354580 [compost metagenome]